MMQPVHVLAAMPLLPQLRRTPFRMAISDCVPVTVMPASEPATPSNRKPHKSNVTSLAAIFRTKKDAETSWNFEAKPQVLNCLAEGLAQTSTGGATVKITSRGKLAFPHVAPRTAAFFVRLAFNVQGIRFNADLHFVCLGSGRANLAVMTFSPGKPLTPLPAALDRTLAAKLASRLHG